MKKEVARLMARARAFLIPVNWEEPFGLVMAEAQSCGTPVIGFDMGAVKEVVKNGETGFVVSPKRGISGLAAALKKIADIKPEKCRKNALENFSLQKMAGEYEKIYLSLSKK